MGRDASQKYLEAGLAGWRVFRLGPDQITILNVRRLADLVRQLDPGDNTGEF